MARINTPKLAAAAAQRKSKDCRVVFHGLNHEEEYIPIGTRTNTQASLNLSLNPIRPKVPELKLPNKVTLIQMFASPAWLAKVRLGS